MFRVRYLLLLSAVLVSTVLQARPIVCDQKTLPSKLPVPFQHTYSAALSRSEPFHSAQDVLISTGEDAVIEGKFTYGSFSQDLGDEKIEVWIDNCSEELIKLGEAITNSDGRSKVVVKPEALPVQGVFRVYHRVLGDNSVAVSTLRILPKGTPIVVFDIDGTLTLSDGELWKSIFYSDYYPVSRKGASEITQFLYGKEFEIVYLSGRHYLLNGRTRTWLSEGNFAPGTLILAQSLSENWPSRGSVGAYKLNHLQRLLKSGFVIHAAYGNASTDIYAYEKANIQKSATYILGELAGTEHTTSLGEDFIEHIQNLTNAENDAHR